MVQFDGLRSARLNIAILSTGRVGVALERADQVVVACSAVSHASRQWVQFRLPETSVASPPEVASSAELLLLAVPDCEFAGLMSGVAVTSVPRPGTIVAHTSWANGVGILAQLGKDGCIPLAIHPAMMFSGSDEDLSQCQLRDTYFGITKTDDVGYAIAQSLVLEMGGEPFCVVEYARILYHSVSPHVGNHIVTVLADALEVRRSALRGSELLGLGVPPACRGEVVDDQLDVIVERIVGSLARAACENTLQRGQAGLTKLVARGDLDALAGHLVALMRIGPELAQAYRVNALRKTQRAHAPYDVVEALAP
ncbi:hypothetical protein JK2ML_0229 [Mycobacterium leprae Kyoto-2]|uniref:Oxidoreductase n=3 Tax=Mycobacterium leprae TaxID=1769 RepID=Q7AQL2_MYCLE|nr:Rossmann-like and DUF2520 domain-containing protein [Mycobacterium leprae]CAR70322.1 conserved hypothetical protein [Mycobacterium leprae Br4923]AWV48930.1 DUF2520 domain-containing protein [Mycobacterium leprae]OAR21430.1 oxidoreductase [Mycobacterium leprae 3125609]OAX71630.1 oxidoreductase [Mycobacterium leprae 7935681]CAA18789.1 hypothetical protein MLCB2548.02c [Mycobacterium leprae]